MHTEMQDFLRLGYLLIKVSGRKEARKYSFAPWQGLCHLQPPSKKSKAIPRSWDLCSILYICCPSTMVSVHSEDGGLFLMTITRSRARLPGETAPFAARTLELLPGALQYPCGAGGGTRPPAVTLAGCARLRRPLRRFGLIPLNLDLRFLPNTAGREVLGSS